MNILSDDTIPYDMADDVQPGATPDGMFMAQQAALIASQAARIRELEEGLEPFAKAANELLERAPDNTHIGVGVLLGHLRRARSLLSRKGGE